MVLFGAIVQLGERYPCKVDVESSSLSSSSAIENRLGFVVSGHICGMSTYDFL